MKHENAIDPNLKKKVKDLLANGKKVEAVATVQNQLKIGLKNSKNLVDGIEKDQELNKYSAL